MSHRFGVLPLATTIAVCLMFAVSTTFATDGVPVVDVDVKPGSWPNSINCNNENEVITVAILTTDDFDATTVDHTTAVFGPDKATETHTKNGEPQRHEEDVDGDGDVDLVFHFRNGDTGIECGAIWGSIRAFTFDGQEVKGRNRIRTVGGNPAPPGRSVRTLTTTWASLKAK